MQFCVFFEKWSPRSHPQEVSHCNNSYILISPIQQYHTGEDLVEKVIKFII